jgi:hypothetical protein
MTNTQSNVIPIEKPNAAPAAKFTVGAVLDGFPVQVEVEGKASDLRALVDRLKAIGATPPNSANLPNNEPSKKSAPLCPVHHSAMKASRKPGSFYCARRRPTTASIAEKPHNQEMNPMTLPKRANFGRFRRGHDPRRHRFSLVECQLGFQRALESIIRRYPNAIGADGRHMACDFLQSKIRKQMNG